MVDGTRDFPALESDTGITSSEREEIRVHIEKVATENRIPVEAAQFSLNNARRGVLLPAFVNVGAVILVAAVAALLTLAFRHSEQRLATQAAQYSSVEGMLIRELRTESRQAMTSKQKEIEDVRQKLKDLEQQLASLNQDFSARLSQKEEEFKVRLKQEVDAERTRLMTQGLAATEMERLLASFEAERKAYYDKQLAAYRATLETEKSQLQSDIERLRSEYSTRLAKLEKEQQDLISGFQKREADLRLQLEQKTVVMEQASAQNRSELEAAQQKLAGLSQAGERARAVENQIDGLSGRIMDAVATGDTGAALAAVQDLQAFLQQDSVRSLGALSSRVRTELFLLGQLRTSLEQARQSQALSEGRSLTDELGLLGQIRRISGQASGSRDPAQKLDLYRQVTAVLPEVQAASAALSEEAVRAAVEQEREKSRTDLEDALAQQAAALASQAGTAAPAASDTGTAAAAQAQVAALQKQVTDLTQGMSQAAARYEAENVSRMDAVATRARTTRDNLDRRIDELNLSADQLSAARAAFGRYVAQEKAARQANTADPMTASREELNKFLRDPSIQGLFTDLADRVNSLYAATQTAGSSAAMAGAAEILQDVARQPTLKASRQRLQYELANAGSDAQLKAILTSMSALLDKAQPAVTP
ncbi:MAG TPA: hypothetical protein VFI08_07340 [Spirochaetia bacterium]|nr:hypothetical protein [Spirochaetia bacterium]